MDETHYQTMEEDLGRISQSDSTYPYPPDTPTNDKTEGKMAGDIGTDEHKERYPWLYNEAGKYDPDFEDRTELEVVDKGDPRIVTTAELEGVNDVIAFMDGPFDPKAEPTRRMSQQEALHHQMSLFGDALDIMAAKRHDYSGTVDPFKNLRDSAFVGVEPMRGVLVRIMDKLARLRSFLDEGTLKVQDEAVRDTCLDILNYTAIFAGLADEEVWLADEEA